MRFLRVLTAQGKWLFMLLLCLAPAYTQAATLMSSEVEVRATGSDATDARAKALQQAEAEAFTKLAKTLAPGHPIDKILPAQIKPAVHGSEILSEKFTGDQYQATVRVSFDGDKLQDLLGTGAATPATLSFSVIVLPVFEQPPQWMLWEEKNPWRQAMSGAALEMPKGQVIVPVGDGDDAAMTAAVAPSAPFAAFKYLLGRYAARVVYVATARPDGEKKLSVLLRRLEGGRQEITSYQYTADNGEAPDRFYARAAADIAAQMTKRVDTERTRTNAAPENASVLMLMPYRRLADWNKLHDQLSALPMVARTEIVAMSPQQVDMRLFYTGSVADLLQLLGNKGWRIEQHPTYWVLTNAY